MMKRFTLWQKSPAMVCMIALTAVGYAETSPTLTVRDGQVILAGGAVKAATDLRFDPAERQSVKDEKLRLPETMPEAWRGGNLAATRTTNAIPGCIYHETLVLRRADDGTTLTEGTDYRADATWGNVGLVPGSSITTATEVLASYDVSLQRLDGVDVAADGSVSVVKGEPHLVCPHPPPVTSGSVRLAHVYRPYKSTAVLQEHIFLCGEKFAEPTRAEQIERSARVAKTLAKLRAGEPVTIVTWGDSVTVGGDTSRPELAFANLFITQLKERFPQAKITHINAAIGGSSTNDRLPGLDDDVLRHKPDLVTMEYVNDFHMPVEQIEKNWDEALTRIKAAGAEPVVITPHFTLAAFMGVEKPPRKEVRPGVQVMRDAAEEHGAALADTSRRWEHLAIEGLPYMTLLYNGINHPDDRGHELFVLDLMNLFPAAE